MRSRGILVALLAVAAFGGMAPGAPATTMKTLSGTTVATGSSLSGSLKSGTSWRLDGGPAGSVTCTTSTLGGSLGTNPMSPAVSASLTSMTVSTCTDTLPFVAVSSVTMSALGASFTFAGTASTFAIHGLRITFTLTTGATCTYAPTVEPATGEHDSHTSPWNGEYAFAEPMTRTGGTAGAGCPTLGVTWSATYVLGMTIQA
ncbi:MAG TPA: hypothetical protein VGW75_01845 [Solirubrobacteraceae bacterium]|nr:hypothetical protein [Solirubrobacteraceae bacterium]